MSTDEIEDGTIVNADVSASAAIVQSKLVDVVNADVGAAAAIAYSKLDLDGEILSADIKDDEIVNADVNSGAAIAQSKLTLAAHTAHTDVTYETQTNAILDPSTSPVGNGHLVFLYNSTAARYFLCTYMNSAWQMVEVL